MEEMQNSNEDANPEEEQETYSFMRETVKDETSYTKKYWKKIARHAGMGIVFGVAACISFVMFKPWIEGKIQEIPGKITIPDEEEIVKLEEEDYTVTVENYRKMNQILNEIARKTEPSIVGIEATRRVFPEENLEDYSENEDPSSAGLIVGDNGKEILILTNSRVYQERVPYSGVFCDGKKYDASLKKKDENIGIAIFSVRKKQISKSTLEKIKVAKLGSSASLTKGNTIVACGNPFGYEDAVGFGVVASPGNKIRKSDGEYQIISTDITGTKGGTGVLVNGSGKIVGLIDQYVDEKDCNSHVTAYGISDLKDAIELLSNGASVPYVGIEGVTVTKELSEEYNIPMGVYVKNIQPDSPAMQAGIQNGDVIVGLDNEKIYSLDQYHEMVMKNHPGTVFKVAGQRRSNDRYVEVNFSVEMGKCE